MPIGIVCPLSQKLISHPVIYNGYIYDRSSIHKLIDAGRMPITKDKLVTDYFLKALIEYIKEKNSTTVAIADLDELYICPITHLFPIKGVLCLVDGQTYDEGNFKRSFLTRKRSPMTNAPINEHDMVYHQAHAIFAEEINKAFNSGEKHINFESIFSKFEQNPPQFIFQKNSDLLDKIELVQNFLICQLFFMINIPWINYQLFSTKLSESVELPVLLSVIASHTYTDFKLYRKSITNIIKDAKNREMDKYFKYSDSEGALHYLSPIKRKIMIMSLFLILGQNTVAFVNSNEQFFSRGLGIWNDPLLKGISSAVTASLFYQCLSRTLVEFNSVSMLLRTDNITNKTKNYFLELFDVHAPRNQGKSSLKVKIEAFTTLAMLLALLPLAAEGLSLSSLFDNENENYQKSLINFLVNFPLITLTTVTAINQIREFIFTRSDSNVSTSKNKFGFFNKIASGLSLTAQAIAGYSTLSAYSPKGFFHSLGLGVNNATKPSFEKCLDDFNANIKITPFFKKLAPFEKGGPEITSASNSGLNVV